MVRAPTDRSVSNFKKRRYRIKLSKHTKHQIRQHARAEAPKECCGFVLRSGEAYKATNTASEDGRFRISAEDYVSADNLSSIEAVYHSHLEKDEPTFSEFDKFNSVSHNIIYILFSMRDNSFTQFDPSLSGFNKYIGRKWKIGKTDCFTLIKDFYKNELNINLSEYHRDENYLSYLEELFDKHYEKEGFKKTDGLRKYDCILFRKKEGLPSNHIAVYLGNGLILHQPSKSFSRVEDYTKRHRLMTNYIIRHDKAN